ncbi:putative endothelin receptor type B [Streptomyces lydicamycinicus]|uniref:Putative endothelin receptor type B n=1 Tax=Streptomyces lydicamycinicus TaxID=1546107 RepID=A0A0P4RBU8_9ACTN|nr:putative endothelin receptor type B [Streptomyces lydicamycinicus]
MLPAGFLLRAVGLLGVAGAGQSDEPGFREAGAYVPSFGRGPVPAPAPE